MPEMLILYLEVRFSSSPESKMFVMMRKIGNKARALLSHEINEDREKLKTRKNVDLFD